MAGISKGEALRHMRQMILKVRDAREKEETAKEKTLEAIGDYLEAFNLYKNTDRKKRGPKPKNERKP
jgi:competence protein ComGF